MRLLLDTNVVAELRRPRGSERVKAVMRAFDDEALFLSVIVLGEIRQGLDQLPESSRQKSALAIWLGKLRDRFADRVIPIDAEIAETWGAMNARLRQKGRSVAAVDGLLAATALVHKLTVTTQRAVLRIDRRGRVRPLQRSAAEGMAADRHFRLGGGGIAA